MIDTPLRIGGKAYTHGLGTHAVSQLRVQAWQPITRLNAAVGVDNNDRTKGKAGSVVFRVSSAGRELLRTRTLRGGDEPQAIDLKVNGVLTLDLLVDDAGDGVDSDHADWADARITLQDGTSLWLDALPRRIVPPSCYPFSFSYGGRANSDLMPGWSKERRTETPRCRPDADDDHLDRSADRLASPMASNPLCSISPPWTGSCG